MGQKKKFEAIRVTSEVHEQAKFLAEKSGKSISKAVSEIIGSVFQVACTFSSLNLSYEYEISSSRVTIQIEGSNNLKSGSLIVDDSVSDDEVAKQIKKRLKVH